MRIKNDVATQTVFDSLGKTGPWKGNKGTRGLTVGNRLLGAAVVSFFILLCAALSKIVIGSVSDPIRLIGLMAAATTDILTCLAILAQSPVFVVLLASKADVLENQFRKNAYEVAEANKLCVHEEPALLEASACVARIVKTLRQRDVLAQVAVFVGMLALVHQALMDALPHHYAIYLDWTTLILLPFIGLAIKLSRSRLRYYEHWQCILTLALRSRNWTSVPISN